MAERQSHPIPDAELTKRIPEAETHLKRIKGDQDLQTVFTGVLNAKEKYRILPEAQALLFAIRRGLCFYLYFIDLLLERTGQKGEVEALRARGATALSPAVQTKTRFNSAYALFVMASSIVAYCIRELKGHNITAPTINMAWRLTVGSGWANDIKYAFAYYCDTLAATTPEGRRLVADVGDLLIVSRVFWQTVAERAAGVCRELPELLDHVKHATFKNDSFAITGLTTEDRAEGKIITFAPVLPSEVVANTDVKLALLRLCDRIACYDPEKRRNPFREFGGIVPSALLDGPPGTGKTTLMRMGMTRLRDRAERIGMPHDFQTLTADQVKTEWYGRTAQLIKEFLTHVEDPTKLALLMLDDFDLLLSAERSISGGADNDIMKALSDFYSGTATIWNGNFLSIAATNRPTASDSALRQRFVYRAVVLGPTSAEDYADLATLQLRGFARTGLLKIAPGRYEPLRRELPTSLAVAFDPELQQKYARTKGSWDDIGALCAALRAKDPEFTGRSVKNAVDVALMQGADFEIPIEWFDRPESFRIKPWEERIAMIRELYHELTAADIMTAVESQFRIEQRYREEAKRRRIEELAREFAAREAALSLAQKLRAEDTAAMQ